MGITQIESIAFTEIAASFIPEYNISHLLRYFRAGLWWRWFFHPSPICFLHYCLLHLPLSHILISVSIYLISLCPLGEGALLQSVPWGSFFCRQIEHKCTYLRGGKKRGIRTKKGKGGVSASFWHPHYILYMIGAGPHLNMHVGHPSPFCLSNTSTLVHTIFLLVKKSSKAWLMWYLYSFSQGRASDQCIVFIKKMKPHKKCSMLRHLWKSLTSDGFH